MLDGGKVSGLVSQTVFACRETRCNVSESVWTVERLYKMEGFLLFQLDLLVEVLRFENCLFLLSNSKLQIKHQTLAVDYFLQVTIFILINCWSRLSADQTVQILLQHTVHVESLVLQIELVLVEEHDLLKLPHQWIFNAGPCILGSARFVRVGALNLAVEIGLAACLRL